MEASIKNIELKRVNELSEFDLDYTSLEENFKDLSKLAANVAGTEISLINLIDSYTQWTIASHGFELEQMPREDSVCQYTIVSETNFEVKDLSKDSRFSQKSYVKDDPLFKYYFGVPLQTSNGNNLGALCVLDKREKEISPEKAELLKIIADEIVNRLVTIKTAGDLRLQLKQANQNYKNLAHDIKGTLGSIITLTDIIKRTGSNNKIEDVLNYIKMIHNAGSSLLDLAVEIMNTDTDKSEQIQKHELNLILFKEKLEKLFAIQAQNKKIQFVVQINKDQANVPFLKNKLLQILSNIISNAIKFTAENGTILVEMDLQNNDENKSTLTLMVRDNGIGMDENDILEVFSGGTQSSSGTGGEKGYGLGLTMVKSLTDSLLGTLQISSEIGKGTEFTIKIPFQK